MEEIIALNEVKRPTIIIDNDIDDSKIMFPEKLKKAKEWLKKQSLPAEFFLGAYSKIEQEHGFEQSGILKYVDMDKNTFLVMEIEGPYETNYYIRTEPKILTQLAKVFLDKPIKVLIRPQINGQKLFEYELIEVKVE